MAQAHAIDAPIKSLIKKLDYSFNDISLLDEALTHRSYAAVNNERLEFLGDGILNFVIAHELFKQYPDVNEESRSWEIEPLCAPSSKKRPSGRESCFSP